MSEGQTRVLVLLGALLGVQAVINPNVRRILSGQLTAGEHSGGALGIPGVYLAGYVGVGASVLALMALAGPAPRLATWIVAIFIALALIEHPAVWVGALQSAGQGITALTGIPNGNGK